MSRGSSRGSDLVASLFLPSDGEYVVVDGIPRRIRLQYPDPDAIYHVMVRGNGRQNIVCDDGDRDRLQLHLGRAANRCSWRIYAFAINRKGQAARSAGRTCCYTAVRPRWDDKTRTARSGGRMTIGEDCRSSGTRLEIRKGVG